MHENCTRYCVSIHHALSFLHGSPSNLPADNRKQFTLRYFTDVCCKLGIANLYTITDHLQTNGSAERLRRTLLAALRHYVAKHKRSLDEFSDALTYVYGTQPRRGTSFALFKFVLARPPPILTLLAHPAIDREYSSCQWYVQ